MKKYMMKEVAMDKQKDAFYFPHFCNARHDRKIRRVRKELGLEGYGIFFMLLEVLREQADFKYPMEDIDLLADELGTSENKVRTVICNYQLFEVDEEEKFFSGNLVMYLQPYLEGKEKKRISGIRGNLIRHKHITKEQSNEMSDNDIVLLHKELKDFSQCDPLAIPKRSQLKESKVNEMKINESILNDPIHKTFTLKWFKNHNKQGGYQLQPTDKDYQYAFEACKKLGNDESILDYTLEDYWENFTEAWYYKKSNRHIFSSFAVNIENHLPPGETEEEREEREKKEESERRKEIEKHNDKFMMGEYYKEVDNAEDGGVDFSRLKNRFN